MAETSADVIEYFDWIAFQVPTGPAIGLASFDNGWRIARITINGRDDDAVAEVIVHEAAHLAGITYIGTCFSLDVAEAAGRQFRRDLQRLCEHQQQKVGHVR